MDGMLDLTEALNPSQHEAVSAIDGPMLVIAGAGSGKTRVIEYRVLNMVQNRVHPGSILLLTFTRKAAREMISRASRHDPRCKNVEGGTFHSFAYRTLKKYSKRIGFPDSFLVLDESDAEEAIHRCAARVGHYEKKKRFPKKGTLRSIISISINKNTTIGEVIKREYPHFIEYLAEIERLRKDYAAYKIDKNYLDYDDLLVYLRILLENEEIRDRLSSRYRYIMVDEYQDTNTLQGDIAQLLARDHENIMVVGGRLPREHHGVPGAVSRLPGHQAGGQLPELPVHPGRGEHGAREHEAQVLQVPRLRHEESRREAPASLFQGHL
jgi:DNA helicase-2/ATP-dependent DNA helicase PcrA